jgi:hypothetical protein
MSEKQLNTIKSRMAWQVGLQTATLFAVGATNSSIKEQTEIISEKLHALEIETIKGFTDVTEALNSIESTLLNGIEDLKWMLGSIDDKLGKIVGLIQYPRATESVEQYKIGMELYKQEFYEKSIICFNSAIEKNPLNLNALCGLYLAKKYYDKKSDINSLFDIVKLTNSDFLYNIDTTDQFKNKNINYFINFCFSEFLINKEYKAIIDLYDTEISSSTREELAVKLKYINAVILSGNDYKELLNGIINEGELEKLLVYFNYEKENKFITEFLKDVLDFILLRIPENLQTLDKNDVKLTIQKKAIFFNENINKNPDLLLKFGFYENGLSNKISKIKTFYDAANHSKSKYESLDDAIKTSKANLKLIKKINLPIYSKNKENFLSDAHSQIVKDINSNINEYKLNLTNKFKKSISTYSKQMDELNIYYPDFEENSDNETSIIRRFLDNIDLDRKSINIDKIFE